MHSINEGIVDAVIQYSRQRDVELAWQNNEHFALVAHELRNPLGFGLGLAIARRALQAHGGSIRVRNRPGEGCTFTIEVALAQASE